MFIILKQLQGFCKEEKNNLLSLATDQKKRF